MRYKRNKIDPIMPEKITIHALNILKNKEEIRETMMNTFKKNYRYF